MKVKKSCDRHLSNLIVQGKERAVSSRVEVEAKGDGSSEPLAVALSARESIHEAAGEWRSTASVLVVKLSCQSASVLSGPGPRTTSRTIACLRRYSLPPEWLAIVS